MFELIAQLLCEDGETIQRQLFLKLIDRRFANEFKFITALQLQLDQSETVKNKWK